MIVAHADLSEVRRLKMVATQRLLGDTIAISESDWHSPTALPGWTRAHVATHLARNAEVLRRLLTRLDTRPPLEPDDVVRDLEAGARRTPLEIQIDLDTSAGNLNSTFNQLPTQAWSIPLDGALEGLTVSDLPMMRLNEVVLHHVDLDCGFGFLDLDPQIAAWLLTWNLQRRRDLATGPGIDLVAASGTVHRVGSGSGTTQVTGTDADLLGWLTGRLPRGAVSGAEHVSVGTLR
jgi:maleylpyruvate isomerase